MQPLSVELGPGILNNIFDGIQRPLKAIAIASGDCFIPRGVAVPALDIVKQWEFHPTTFKVRAWAWARAQSATGRRSQRRPTVLRHRAWQDACRPHLGECVWGGKSHLAANSQKAHAGHPSMIQRHVKANAHPGDKHPQPSIRA